MRMSFTRNIPTIMRTNIHNYCDLNSRKQKIQFTYAKLIGKVYALSRLWELTVALHRKRGVRWLLTNTTWTWHSNFAKQDVPMWVSRLNFVSNHEDETLVEGHATLDGSMFINLPLLLGQLHGGTGKLFHVVEHKMWSLLDALTTF